MFRRAGRALDLTAALLCLAAWLTAWPLTRDLDWPCESDFYRDLGAAQSALDGQLGSDPAYAGERGWYNPLIPALVALLSRLSGTELAEAYSRFGVHLNLLAPIAFYVMLAAAFQRGVALAGLVGFLFLGQLDLMSWLHATYSPWLWPCNLAQAFFFAAVALSIQVFRKRRLSLAALAGVGFGLTALAHTAPALLLLSILFGLVLREMWAARLSRAARKQTLALAAAIVGIGALVAAPFWVVVAFHYGAHIKNPAPLSWVAGELSVQSWDKLALREVSLRGLLALIGLASLLRGAQGQCPRARIAVLGWGASAAVGLAYGFAAQRILLPPLLPSWHFYFYLQALESVLFGLGMAVLVRTSHRLLAGGAEPSPQAQRSGLALGVAALLGLLLARLDYYRDRPDLVRNRADSLALARHPTRELYEFVRSRLRPADVVLADEGTSFMAILPAGRKTVALPALFSNPYVDHGARSRDAATMLKRLARGRYDQFASLAQNYGVRYVALPAAKRKFMSRKRFPRLQRVLTSSDKVEGFDLYELDDGTPELAQ